MFHFVMSTVTDGEAYNMAIRGGDWGGLDGVDVWGTNVWIHDVSYILLLSLLLHSRIKRLTPPHRSW
jgi:hypothetical protein